MQKNTGVVDRRFVTVALTAAALAIPSAALWGIAAPAGAVVPCHVLNTERHNHRDGYRGRLRANAVDQQDRQRKVIAARKRWDAQMGTEWKDHNRQQAKAHDRKGMSGGLDGGDRDRTVTGGTSTYTKKGDVFSAKVCIKGSTVAILKGSKVLL